MEESYHLHSRVLHEMNLNSWRGKMQSEVLGKPFHSLSLYFQKVSNFTHFQSINQTNNQTINHIYLFNITFQNLEFWDVTNLPHLK